MLGYIDQYEQPFYKGSKVKCQNDQKCQALIKPTSFDLMASNDAVELSIGLKVTIQRG